MGVKSIKEEDFEFEKQTIEVLFAIHGDDDFEIRFLFENDSPTSFLKHGDYFYYDSVNGKKPLCKVTPENFHNYILPEILRGNCGVFFTPNSPNFDVMPTCVTSDRHIIDGGKIICQFVDIDAPKEIRNNNEKMKKWKLKVKEKVQNCPAPPSIVIATKNGYHVYWLLEDGNINLFRHIQMQLVQYFDGDTNSINESRVLRLPGFTHLKNPKNPFPVSIKVYDYERKYIQRDLKKAFPELSEGTLTKLLKKKSSLTDSINEKNKTILINQILKKVDAVKEDKNKIILHCCMPDHLDRHPSAWIDTQYMWFHCSGCRKHYPINELAKILNWKEVTEILNQYKIDIESTLKFMRDKFVTVDALEHLSLNSKEREEVDSIVFKVLERFESFGQKVSEQHRKYIFDIVQILYKGDKSKPYLIPLDMGGGKSTIIKVFLEEMLKKNNQFGAIVVVERREDAKKLVRELKDEVGSDCAYALYGFVEEECKLKGNKCYSNCPYLEDCRYRNKLEQQENFPILIITTERLFLESDKLVGRYSYFIKSGKLIIRDRLIIDEKPKMVKVWEINDNSFQSNTREIIGDLETIECSLKVLQEFRSAVNRIYELFKSEMSYERVLLKPLDEKVKFSDEFYKVFYKIYDYTQEIFQVPIIVENLLRYGGHKESKDGNVTLVTGYYNTYDQFGEFCTTIFDGTADIDSEYLQEKFYTVDFEPLKSYEGVTIYESNICSATKTNMKKGGFIKAFCEDVKEIAKDNPGEIIFLTVFKSIESEVRGNLDELIKAGRIKVAHYGETRGSNDYRDCSIVILGGILHKTENYYIEKANAIYKQRGIAISESSSCNINKVRRFNESNIEVIKILDMLVDYSQELKRSNLRDNTRDTEVKVYIFHNDKILLENIGLKLPGCKIIEWFPKNIIRNSIFKKNNNKKVQAICDYIEQSQNKVIYFEEIRKAVGVSKQQFSNIMGNNPSIQGFIKAKNYGIEKMGQRKALVKKSVS